MSPAVQSVASLKGMIANGAGTRRTAVSFARPMALRLEAKHGVVISNGKPKNQHWCGFIRRKTPQKKAQSFSRKAPQQNSRTQERHEG
jgi:hypothetical protein